MDNMIMEFIKAEALIIVPVCWIIGFIIKKIQAFNDKYIPAILFVSGIGVALALLGVSVPNAVQGVLCAGAAIGVHQAKKQTVEK